MASPPSSLPSPAPSSSSGGHPHTFSSLAMPPPAGPQRAPSAASGVSAASGRDSKASGYPANGNSGPVDNSFPNGYHESSQQTPQPHHNHASFPPNLGHHPFLPSVTSSPPPHVPPYVPPPQHAMAPDPIHTMMNQPGASGSGGMSSPTQGGWPTSQNGWRAGGPGQSGYPGPNAQYPRQLPNGLANPSMQHQLPPNPIDSFGGGRGPLSSLSSSGRPVSRDRRRDREGREERDGEEEVITTIFVVGFPDDMLEREFQNIFTFAPGFEAATLKFPSGSNRPREPAAALLAELQQLAASQAGELGEHGISAPLEEAIAALQISSASSSSTTPSAAISMTPSGPTGPVLANQPYSSQSTRRQTIGFARFKTRADALAAREHLQGRKIDTLTGATLKAEMAKKNLHTKRTTSGEELVGLLLRSGRLAGLVGGGPGPGGPPIANGFGGMPPPQSVSQGQTQSGPSPYGHALPNPSAREAWDSWPNNHGHFQASQLQNPNDDRVGSQQNLQNPPYSYQNGPSSGSLQPPTASAPSNASTSPPLSATSPSTRPTDSKALLALAEEADEMEGWSVGGAVDSMGFEGFNSGRRVNAGQPQPINHANMGMSGPGRDMFGTSPPAGSDQMSDAGRSMGGVMSGSNPADQNPPINTLYVGNLPAISPPTLPPNFLEESLRVLFQTCPGYKRMSFRQKINGPMCFVEFEDVGFAANAIQTLYGHNLNGLVKGGIRLSYSKNSLGQRGANHPIGGNGPAFGGLAHTVALAGMSQNNYGSQSNPSAPPNGGFGLQLQNHGQSAPAGPGSAPILAGLGSPSQSAPAGPGQTPATSLSPNAQPFALPSTSPRSRYFGPTTTSTTSALPVPVPNANSKADPNASFQAFQNSSTSPSTASGQFSPVRTPASFSWVSSGSAMTGNGGYVLGSLDGAASAWGSTPSSGGNNGIGQTNH